MTSGRQRSQLETNQWTLARKDYKFFTACNIKLLSTEIGAICWRLNQPEWNTGNYSHVDMKKFVKAYTTMYSVDSIACLQLAQILIEMAKYGQLQRTQTSMVFGDGKAKIKSDDYSNDDEKRLKLELETVKIWMKNSRLLQSKADQFNSKLKEKPYNECIKLLVQEQERSAQVMSKITDSFELRSKYNEMIEENEKLLRDEQKTKDMLSTQKDGYEENLIKLQENMRNILNDLEKALMAGLTDFADHTKQCENVTTQHARIEDKILNSDRKIKTIEKKSREYDKIHKKCEKLTQEYQSYQIQTDQAQNKMSNVLERKWDSLERIWWNWDYDDVVLWFKYTLGHLGKDNNNNNDNLPNFDYVRRNLASKHTTGERISLLRKDDLRKLGFQAMDDQKTLRKAIKHLARKYPKPSDSDSDSDENVDVNVGFGGNGQLDTEYKDGDDVTQSIDDKYICPLTKKIFVNPVLAANNIVYERDAIIEWLTKYRKYPQSEKVVKDVKHEISLLFDVVQLKKEITRNMIQDVTFDAD